MGPRRAALAVAIAGVGVLASSPAGAMPPPPTVTPSTVAPGDSVVVSGTGCTIGDGPGTLTIFLADNVDMHTAAVATDGSWSTTIVIPATTPDGALAVYAFCAAPYSNPPDLPAQFGYPAAFVTVQAAPAATTTTVVGSTTSSTASPATTTTVSEPTAGPAAAVPVRGVASFTG